MASNQELEFRAKKYSRIKYRLAIFGLLYSLVLLILFQGLGLSQLLKELLLEFTTNKALVVCLYVLAISFIFAILDLPFNLYGGYFLEHRFKLSRQKLKNWFFDQFKSGIISLLIFMITVEVFYFCLSIFPRHWWIAFASFWISLSIILARLLPTLIIPIFFKYQPLRDDQLKERILQLARKMGVKVINVFEIDFSKKTLKANAAFVGIGKSKRIILADTLKNKYSSEEIEVILAHEFAHYRLRHLFKLICAYALVTIFALYALFKTNQPVLDFFKIKTLSDLAGFPVVLLCWTVITIVFRPWENYLSRYLERNADILALKATGLKGAFITTMEKLAQQNLADRNPERLIKIFFFDHPPIDERIEMARRF